MIRLFIIIIAVLEFVQGALSLVPIFFLVGQNSSDLSISAILLFLAIAVVFFGAGILLLRAERTGIVLSFFIQFFQVFVIETSGWRYKLLLGPGASFSLGNVGDYAIEINTVPLAFCIVIAIYNNMLRRA